MSRKLLFAFSVLGFLGGLASAYVFGIRKPPLPPAFRPSSNPYAAGIFANGIVESLQPAGANVNLYPEVAGRLVELYASEGEHVTLGAPLFKIDDSVQRPMVEQQKAQAAAARAALEELRAQPRKETLEVAKAQVDHASAGVKLAQDQYRKKKEAYDLAPKSVSKEDLDTSENQARVAEANLGMTRRQFELQKAGAWEYDVRTQEHQVEALRQAAEASEALLAKYVVRAPADGVILSVNAAVGSLVSAQGTYDTYTQGMIPVVVMGTAQSTLAVRCYVDEILVHRLPRLAGVKAQMRVRGTDVQIPLQYVRTTPYVTPKIQLSNQRTERVDVRVLPVIFKFERPKDVALYPGQLVDVYIEGKGTGESAQPVRQERSPEGGVK